MSEGPRFLPGERAHHGQLRCRKECDPVYTPANHQLGGAGYGNDHPGEGGRVPAMKRKNVIIMGAAGRDFHNFNVVFRDNPDYRVKAFTAAQIPFIAARRYPPSLAGRLYPTGIPVYPEAELEQLIVKYKINEVIFAYSDISHVELMHKA